jgi:hypothetical protein
LQEREEQLQVEEEEELQRQCRHLLLHLLLQQLLLYLVLGKLLRQMLEKPTITILQLEKRHGHCLLKGSCFNLSFKRLCLFLKLFKKFCSRHSKN